jgi:hypothetical protein
MAGSKWSAKAMITWTEPEGMRRVIRCQPYCGNQRRA